MEYSTLPRRLLDAVDRYHSPSAQMYKAGGRWESIPAEEVLRRIAGLAKAMDEIGVREGDRVAIFAPNCPEWHIADFAASGLGGVVVPVYFRESPERIEYILGHAGAKIVFVAGEDQSARLAALRHKIPSVERVIVCAAGQSGQEEPAGDLAL